ncbi:transposable element Tcb2 transposase [Trichonephila clavipes]|nr:transposable element Tcb2 transposase [Trichonephila clavipes]
MEFMYLYWTYPTVVDIQQSSPSYLQAPAFTICNPIGYNFTELCYGFEISPCLPESFRRYASAQICEKFPLNCFNGSLPEDHSEVLGPVDPRDVIYVKTRLRTPSTDKSWRRPPHRKKCPGRANFFIGRHPGTGSTFSRDPVSARIIRRRLAEGHLGSRRPLRVLSLMLTHRRLRLEWCRARGNWIAAEWNQVVFSDESRFNLSSVDNRVRVWKPRGERLNPAFALQRRTTSTVGVMVWGAIAYNTRSPLVLIHDTWQPSGAIFQQDNARTHTARVSQDCLRTVTALSSSDRSPDLSPIEHIWDHLGRRVGHPPSLNELEARLQQIWNEMSQDIIQNLYASMPDHIASCIRARGGSTRY